MNRSTKRFVFFKNYLFYSYICVYFQFVALVREHMWHENIEEWCLKCIFVMMMSCH